MGGHGVPLDVGVARGQLLYTQGQSVVWAGCRVMVEPDPGPGDCTRPGSERRWVLQAPCPCIGSTNVEDTLIYFVSKVIVDYAFLLYFGLLNGPRNSRTENARWQPHIAISVVDLTS